MEKMIAFIGCGNMGSAIVQGCLNGGIDKDKIIATTFSQESCDNLSNKLQIKVIRNNKEAVNQADIIVFCVKPNKMEEVVLELKDNLTADKTIVSVAAGVKINQFEEWLSKEHKIVRTMPNTPCLVQEGMTALCFNSIAKNDKKCVKEVQFIFENCGQFEIVDENLIDAVIGVSGSAVAYVYMMIEAMADGAVLEGMPKNQAYRFASQAVLGAAKMVLSTNEHPGLLKDKVCSPKGTTIAAVHSLEKNGFRGAVIDAVVAAAEKSKKM